MLFQDPKRKALEQLDPPTPSKRIKNSHSVPTDDKKSLTVVPYPEKVRTFMPQLDFRCSAETNISLCV